MGFPIFTQNLDGEFYYEEEREIVEEEEGK